MKIQVLFFGITTDLVGSSALELNIADVATVADFKNSLKGKYQQLEKLNSYAIAVNESYATDDFLLKENDVVAVIPPVSGG
ncbi:MULTISPECIES: molybdopterin converting factor subunit 1 [unclassified Polaribacter]|jgi:molybdopterin converting factor subunit 1|uniref:molybdopterin converting factor subunit 1 n=1 Tax=unclassified Polaribacter TaxID=196858 RepID=UPI001C4F5AA4|nr:MULTISPECIES: molybdopterin converting factor subunit 1 [unclassified Polaribacter]QXP66044.1 molybdopterin converting factor subunit 1 [Polaribacter sp. AHE13PA]QXP71533.1 molybdopterin converting factor subunit 1 [Polaribacter sp. R2A056_3_33]